MNKELYWTESQIYSLMSRGFLFPDKNLFVSLHDGEYFERMLILLEQYNRLNNLKKQISFPSFEPPKSVEEFEELYANVFTHSISKECPPYETYYNIENIFQQFQMLADIGGFYKAFGLKMSESAFEREDHISVELEFMSFLCTKLAYAYENHTPEQIKILEDAKKKFLKEHLARWVPAFSDFLKKKAKGFYFSLAVLLDDFINLECELNGIKYEKENLVKLNINIVDSEPFSCNVTNPVD